MRVKYSFNEIDSKTKYVNSLYNKFILNPVSKLLVYAVANFTEIKPYVITIIGTFISLGSAILFYNGFLLLGAFLFQISEILDGCDGLLAKTKKIESVFGTFLDFYTDVLRLTVNIIAFSLFLIKKNLIETAFLLFVFLSLNFAESFIDISYSRIKNIYLKTKEVKFTKIEQKILNLKNYLEKKGLKVNLFHYHERIFFVLFISPITGKFKAFTIIGIFLVLLSIHIKIILDIAIIKDHIINHSKLYIRVK